MNTVRSGFALAAVYLVGGSLAFAAGEDMPNESGMVLSAVQRNPNATLHKSEHKEREARVVGIINGIVNKLTNLSERIENQLANANRIAPPATSTAKLELTVREAQQVIAATIQSLQTIPESDKPATLIPEIREQVQMLRSKVEAVRLELIAFHKAL